MKTEQIPKGVAVNEVMRDWAFENHLKRLAEQRDGRMDSKKGPKKEACTGGCVQASIKEITLDNNSTNLKKCQAGGVWSD